MKFLMFLRAIIAPIALACLVASTQGATILPAGESCFQATAGVNGMVGALGSITGGSGGTTGTYGGVALTGGSGSGATANITVAGGLVTGVALLNPGTQYVVGDVLSAVSANIGNVTGFSVPVNSTSINSSLAGGTVAFYIPNTQTFKQTWQDSGQTILNQNPVPLDQNGCAIVYGEGVYRQLLKDSLGNTVWDQLTASTDQAGFYYAGLSTGTPNAIVVTDPTFSETDGQGISFRASGTNTGATTLTVAPYGPIPIVKDTAAGPVALTGAEIAIGAGGQNNVVSVIFDAANTEFHLVAYPPSNTVVETVPYQGGFKNLAITNGTSPNFLINIQADQLVLQNSAGATAKISSVGCNINITTNTFAANAGGMDLVASESPVAQWISIWAIYNPTTKVQSCLGSLSTSSPVLPTGYSFAARFGWMTTDPSANLFRIAQKGRNAHYVNAAGSNTSPLPLIVTGSSSQSGYAQQGIAAFVPPTADSIVLSSQITGVGNFGVAPDANFGSGTIGNFYSYFNVSTTTAAVINTIPLESSSFYWIATVGGGGASYSIVALGWEDNL